MQQKIVGKMNSETLVPQMHLFFSALKNSKPVVEKRHKTTQEQTGVVWSGDEQLKAFDK